MPFEVHTVSSNLNVGGITIFQNSSITRAANVTPYSAGDIIANAVPGTVYFNFPKSSQQGGYITYAKLSTLNAAGTAQDTGITGDFNIHVFQGTQSIATYNDNTTFAMSAAECNNNYLGYITVTVATIGGMKVAINASTLRFAFFGHAFICVLETVTGYTPSANSIVYSIELGLEQNIETDRTTLPFGLNS